MSVAFQIYIICITRCKIITRWKVLWESTTSRESEIWGFCRQHLATLATPTIRSIKCKQSPVYGVFWSLLPHPSTDHNETRTWSSLSPRNLPVKFGTNTSTIFLVIVVTDIQTDRQTDRQTHKPTPVKNILPRFRWENSTKLFTTEIAFLL